MAPDRPPVRLTPRQRVGVAAVLTGAAVWFLVAFAVRNKTFVEAVGEAAGATSAFLLVLSVAGVARGR
jgi:hypothetical protein